MRTCLVLWIAAAAGCNFANSDSVPNSELRADIQVLADGSGQTFAFAWLWSHRPGDPPLNEDSIRLSAGDQLVAHIGSETIAMQEDDLVAEYRYSAALAGIAPGTPVTLDFIRSGQPPLSSSVSLPAPFAIAAPSSFSRASNWTITWSPSGSGDSVFVDIEGTCALAHLGPVPDSGALALAAGSVPPRSSDQAAATCGATLTVRRSRDGALDPRYGQGGSIVAVQQRTATVQSAP